MTFPAPRMLVTGGSSDIEWSVARMFALAGSAVGIFGRNADTLSKAVEELGGSGEGPVYSAVADVADE
ncbi:hypothetical protein FXW78_21840 [Rhodococcus opacus]|nr:hypothetical protein [Rhodococcus opacus]